MTSRNHEASRPATLGLPGRLSFLLPLLALAAAAAGAGAAPVEIIDATGDGSGSNPLDEPAGIAVDGSGNVYVAGTSSNNAFKITPMGAITEIIDDTGDGMGNSLSSPSGIAVDGAGNVYVTSFRGAFEVTPAGGITEIIDFTGDGMGNSLFSAGGIAVDGAGNVYVTGKSTDNAFKITPGGTITEIIDATGDGSNILDDPQHVAVDGSGNVYVTGWRSHNAFKITPGGAITQIIDSSGDGSNALSRPEGVAVDGSGNVYVAGSSSHNAFKITPGGTITEIIDLFGNGSNFLFSPWGIAVDAAGNVYVTGDDNAFRITPGGVITEIIHSTDIGNFLSFFRGVAVDAAGFAYVTANFSHNAFKVCTRAEACFSKRFNPEEIDAGGVSTLTFTLDNGSGATAANSLAFTDPLPGDVAVAPVPDAATTCGGSLSPSPGDTSIVFTGGSLAAGATCTIAVDVTSATVGTYDNTTGDLTSSQGNHGSASATLTVRPVQVDFTAASQSNDESVTPVTVTAELSAVSPAEVQVPLVFGGSADDPADYSPSTHTLVIPAGMTSASLTLSVVDDGVEEFDETVVVTMDTPTGGAAAGTTAVHTATIADNDPPPVDTTGTPIQIIDESGSTMANILRNPFGVAVDGAGNVYVAGFTSDSAFKIAPGGTITEIIDAAGDGTGNPLDRPYGIAVDGSGNVYVTGSITDNAFKITPAGVITEIIDATGDSAGKTLEETRAVAVDSSGNVYVTGSISDNAFKITPGGVITEIIDASGDGLHPLDRPTDIAVDGSGNVYVNGADSDNVFKITPAGVITEIIDAAGDGAGKALDRPEGLAADDAGNVYVAGLSSRNAFEITPGGAITRIIGANGDGMGNPLVSPESIAVNDSSGNVYVAGSWSSFRITPAGVITKIIDTTGDGLGNVLSLPKSIAVDGSDNAYITGFTSDNAFQITPAGVITEIVDETGDGMGVGSLFREAFGIAVDGSGNVYATARASENVFKITPGGVITEIAEIGDGNPSTGDGPQEVAVDASGNVYVTAASQAFQITPGGVMTQIIDATGDGMGNSLSSSIGIAVDGTGNVYVAGFGSDNAFKITPGGTITEIIDGTGDGLGNVLFRPNGIAVDGAGNVYVSGRESENVFKITPGGTITEIIDATGDGLGNPLDSPAGVAVDGSGNVYVAASQSGNTFKITPGGGIIEMTDSYSPWHLAVDETSGNVYVSGLSANNAFKITPGGTVTEILDAAGDGAGNPLTQARGIAVGPQHVYVSGTSSNNAFKVCVRPVCFTKGFAPATIEGGETSTLTFTLDGSGNGAGASALAFTDPLPPGVVVAPVPDAATTCGGSFTPPPSPGDTSISFSGGTLAANATCTVVVDVTSATGGDHLNVSGDLTSNLGSHGPATATLSVVVLNQPPTITVLEPDGAGDTVDASFLIQWSDADADDDAAISLFYDDDDTGEDGTLITGPLSEDPDGAGDDDFTWDTTVIADGDYFIYAVIDDGVNPPVVDYSAGPVTVESSQTVDFTAAAQSNAESVASVTVTAQLSALSGVAVDVPVTFGGTAAEPADYGPSSATITIPAGMLSADLTLSVVDDALDEDDETVVVTMGVPVNAMAGTVTVHTATIEDDDPAPAVSFTAAAQSNAESVTAVTVTAQLSSLSGKEVQVPLAFAGDAADPADYSPSTATLVIPAGQMSADLTLTVVDDGLDEANEIVDVAMGTPVNAGLGATTVHTAIIGDDDPPPVVEFTSGFQSNAESVSPVTVTAELSALSGKEVQVPVTFGGTAADPDDYSPSGTTITIPAGQLSADLTLTVVDDALDEGSELVDVTMGIPVNATLGTTTVHTALIQDNDAPPEVDFTAASQSNAESVAAVTVTAELSAVSGQAVQVPLVFGGTAADPGDYSPSTGTITVPAGQTSADLTLTVVDDGDNENDETVVVTMGTPVNATAGTTTAHTATIEDDEGPEVTVLEPDGLADLADASFTIMWTDDDPNDDASISLFYDTDDGGEDGTEIASGLSEDPDGAGAGNDDFAWDTSSVPGGDYFVYAVIDDGFHAPVVDYSAGPVTVNHAPAITVLEPDGTDDTADDTFLLSWDDAEDEDDATIDLFYDVDASGEDGTFIVSTSEDPDGAGDQHLWDTSLVGDGAYFVYAVIDDGVNPPVVDYSAGLLTVDHSAISCAPPASGDWMVSASCTMTASDTAPGDVIVAPGVVLTVDNHVTLEIDLVNHQLLVQAGGGVLVRPLGAIRQP